MAVQITVNGQTVSSDAAPSTPLLYVLRNDLGLNGPRFGCGLSQCGACTIHLNGTAVHSCVTPLSRADGQELTTLEGLGSGGQLHPLQQAFIDEQAGQCAYCVNGMLMSAAALLHQTPSPSDDQIKQALNGNLCRCGTHLRFLRAIKRVMGATL